MEVGSVGDAGCCGPSKGGADLEGFLQDGDMTWLPCGNCACPNHVFMENDRRAIYTCTSGSGFALFCKKKKKRKKSCFV